ncbi:MAG: hemolysin family protein [Desulfovibrionaceae bacterium]|nr:hemolysin family protein [Desulfovibrionaceae bacterium]
MFLLIFTTIFVVGVSALCSLTESALYSVSWPQIENLRKKSPVKGEILYQIRTHIERPITAVLTLNTFANTAGASVAGALASAHFGQDGTVLYAGGLTLMILVFGEIIPKTLGVVHCVSVASAFAKSVRLLVILFSPFIWVSGLLTRLLMPRKRIPVATEEDIRAVTRLSLKTGQIHAYEEHTILNVLSMDQKHVHDIMTHRTLLFSLPVLWTADQAYALPGIWRYSRIPLYDKNNEDIVGIVQRKDIVRCVADGEGTTPLISLMTPVHFVLENLTLDRLLIEFLETRQHLFTVIDEYGGLSGVVSIGDVLGALVGREIIEASEGAEEDLREAARKRKKQLLETALSSPSKPQ